jgi:hypothetical protein
MKLDNNGNTLINKTNLTVAEHFHQIAIDPQNNIHIVFPDDRDGNLEIYYKKGYASGFLRDISVSDADITFSNPAPTDGEVITISAEVHNVGIPEPAVTVNFYLDSVTDDTLIGSATINVPENSSAIAEVQWSAVVGTHTIIALVDPANVILEHNEYNNEARKNITVSAIPKPL